MTFNLDNKLAVRDCLGSMWSVAWTHIVTQLDGSCEGKVVLIIPEV